MVALQDKTGKFLNPLKPWLPLTSGTVSAGEAGRIRGATRESQAANNTFATGLQIYRFPKVLVGR